jgi:hypothetical protein
VVCCVVWASTRFLLLARCSRSTSFSSKADHNASALHLRIYRARAARPVGVAPETAAAADRHGHPGVPRDPAHGDLIRTAHRRAQPPSARVGWRVRFRRTRPSSTAVAMIAHNRCGAHRLLVCCSHNNSQREPVHCRPNCRPTNTHCGVHRRPCTRSKRHTRPHFGAEVLPCHGRGHWFKSSIAHQHYPWSDALCQHRRLRCFHVVGLASQTASLTDQLDGDRTRHPWPSLHGSTPAAALCDRSSQ